MTSGSLRFELDRLSSYDERALVAEIQRVAALLPEGPMTRAAFDRTAKASSSSLLRRFGGWREALAAAGLEHRYSGRTVNDRMRVQPARGISNDDMVAELCRVASSLDTQTLTRSVFDRHARDVKASAVARRFGSWRAALEVAGLSSVPLGRRWTDDDYFENLLDVWTFHGRQPKYREMNQPPSRITNGAYEKKYGTWTKALVGFVERVTADLKVSEDAQEPLPAEPPEPRPKRSPPPPDGRHIRLGLRYEVLRRDHFRCVLCGASPAIAAGVVLHIDHTLPLARGGKTVDGNLRTLCHDCNIGKGSKVE